MMKNLLGNCHRLLKLCRRKAPAVNNQATDLPTRMYTATEDDDSEDDISDDDAPIKPVRVY